MDAEQRAIGTSGGASAARALDAAALGDFVAEHYDRLIRLARLVSHDVDDADDAVQAGLEVAWRRRSTLRDEALLRPWLDRIVVREAIRVGRVRRSWLSRLVHPTSDVGWIATAGTRQEPGPTRVALQRAFLGLSAEQRAVVALHLHAGYSIAETADMVDAPIETVRSRLRLARERLRHALEEVVQ